MPFQNMFSPWRQDDLLEDLCFFPNELKNNLCQENIFSHIIKKLIVGFFSYNFYGVFSNPLETFSKLLLRLRALVNFLTDISGFELVNFRSKRIL